MLDWKNIVFAVIVLITPLQSQEVILPPSNFFQDIDGISIAPGLLHICAIEAKLGAEIGGKARCWGDSDFGKTEPPKDLVFVQLVSSSFATCGITVSQTVHCWGHIESRHHQIQGLYTQITSSARHFCGVRLDGTLSGWGPALFDPPRDYPDKFVQVSCSSHHCCALTDKAHVHCFGEEGQLSSEMEPPLLVRISDSELDPQEEELESKKEDEDFYEEEEGEDKDEEEEEAEGSGGKERKSKVESKILSLQFKQISVASLYSCGILLSDESLVCWGRRKDHLSHVDRVVPGPFKQVSVGDYGVCALRYSSATQGKTKKVALKSPSPANADGKKQVFDESASASATAESNRYNKDESDEYEEEEDGLIVTAPVQSSIDKEDEEYEDEDEDEDGEDQRVGKREMKMDSVDGDAESLTEEEEAAEEFTGLSSRLDDVDVAAAKLAGRHRMLECWGTAAHWVPEKAQYWEVGWDQVSVTSSVVCVVSMDSEMHCWGHLGGGMEQIPPDLIVA